MWGNTVEEVPRHIDRREATLFEFYMSNSQTHLTGQISSHFLLHILQSLNCLYLFFLISVSYQVLHNSGICTGMV